MALQEQGHDVTISESIPAKMQMVDGVERVVGLAGEPEADVVVLQRPLSRQVFEVIGHLQDAGVAVVVELDDDFTSIHPRNVAWEKVQPHNDPHHNWRWLQRSCERADAFVCTTEILRKYKPENSTVIPNYVPEWYTTINSTYHQPPHIGWSGSLNVHPNDLPEVGSGVAQLVREGTHHFRVVGTGVGVPPQLNLPEEYDCKPTEWVPIEDYPNKMAEIDIGIVPLKLTDFNHAKSWLKGLEFAACGVPFVASATQPYIDLVSRYGIGAVVLKQKHWKSQIARIDPEPDGIIARQKVLINDLTIERRAEEWLRAWQSAADARSKNAA